MVWLMRIIGVGHWWAEPLRIRVYENHYIFMNEPLWASFHDFSSPTHLITESFPCAMDTVGSYPHSLFLLPFSLRESLRVRWCLLLFLVLCLERWLPSCCRRIITWALMSPSPSFNNCDPYPHLPPPWVILKQILIILLFPTYISVCIFKD